LHNLYSDSIGGVELLSSCAGIDPTSLADARDVLFGRRSMVRYIDRSLLRGLANDSPAFDYFSASWESR
jgi:hypothetical protein